MATLSPKFLVFDSNKGSKGEHGELIYCPSKNANVQWPKTSRRGRPRKEESLRSSKYLLREAENSSKQRYGFVECSDGQRPSDSNTRKFVRSHVMRDYRQQKRVLRGVPVGSEGDEAMAVTEPEIPSIQTPERWRWDPFESFPIKMLPYMQDLLYLYISTATEYLYPIEAYWGFNPSRDVWVPLALTDPVLLNSVLFTSEQFLARMTGKKECPLAINHLTQTIQILNERLRDPSQQISDPTIAAVTGLALTEQSSGNHENWRIHMEGIKRMVEMRGGLSTFESNSILYDKLCRADICGAIRTLSKPYLQMEIRRVYPSDLEEGNDKERTLAPGFKAIHDDHEFDPDLFDILCTVHAVTQDINTVNPPKSESIPLQLRKRIRSVQYGLLSIEDDDTGRSGDKFLEACRLGALLYVGIIQNEFRIWPVSHQLLWQLNSCLQKESFTTDAMRSLRLWVMFLASSLMLNPVDESWVLYSIAEEASHLSIRNWCDAKLLLETFAWAGKAQDRTGRDTWDAAVKIQRSS
ncbi:fungal-specific transcription factor domain-containing protein [Hypoxylon crocopeplum]|nr:fungal-specific transcription factor domain-containing protein [Hypoxylon crocopeplum]